MFLVKPPHYLQACTENLLNMGRCCMQNNQLLTKSHVELRGWLQYTKYMVTVCLVLCRGAEEARARAARLRLQRGIWTSTNFGDLRRALAGELSWFRYLILRFLLQWLFQIVEVDILWCFHLLILILPLLHYSLRETRVTWCGQPGAKGLWHASVPFRALCTLIWVFKFLFCFSSKPPILMLCLLDVLFQRMHLPRKSHQYALNSQHYTVT